MHMKVIVGSQPYEESLHTHTHNLLSLRYKTSSSNSWLFLGRQRKPVFKVNKFISRKLVRVCLMGALPYIIYIRKTFWLQHYVGFMPRRSTLPFSISKQLPPCFPYRKQVLFSSTICMNVSTAGFPPPDTMAFSQPNTKSVGTQV